MCFNKITTIIVYAKYEQCWLLCRVDDLFRVTRGAQRAIGGTMIITPSGSDRHYTMDFASFCERYNKDASFAQWLQQPHDDIRNLAAGTNWKGQGPFPMGSVWHHSCNVQRFHVLHPS